MKDTKSEVNIEKILDELSLKYERHRIILFKEFFVTIWVLIDKFEMILFDEDRNPIRNNKASKEMLSFVEKFGGKNYKKVFLEKKYCSFSEDYIAKRLYDLYGK